MLVLWAGSAWSLAAWVVPTLFTAQPDRQVAGAIAARLFGIETYVGLGVALLAVLLPGRRLFLCGYAAAALLSINEWVLKPLMTQAHAHGGAAGLGFGAWHAVSAGVYILACLALAVQIWRASS